MNSRWMNGGNSLLRGPDEKAFFFGISAANVYIR